MAETKNLFTTIVSMIVGKLGIGLACSNPKVLIVSIVGLACPNGPIVSIVGLACPYGPIVGLTCPNGPIVSIVGTGPSPS